MISSFTTPKVFGVKPTVFVLSPLAKVQLALAFDNIAV